MEKQLTKEQAIAFGESGVWKKWTDEQIVRFQLFQERMCMDFSRFHEAVSNVLGRPVFTHEFAYENALKEEYLETRKAPTFQEIIDLIPADKRIIILPNDLEI